MGLFKKVTKAVSKAVGQTVGAIGQLVQGDIKGAIGEYVGKGSEVVMPNPDYSEYNNKNKAEKERKDTAADNKRTEVAKKKNALQYKVFVKEHADNLKNILGIKG